MCGLESGILFVGLVALAAVVPEAAIGIISLAVAGQVGLGLLHLLASLTSLSERAVARCSHASSDKRFSVHIATHEEPPELVRRTVLALSRQEAAPPYEVIVVDNNTTDPALWRPVEHLCWKLGPSFRFFHETNVRGAKAGALNIALERSDPTTTHVVVVDADYEVSTDFLAAAAQALSETNDDFVQFPQAYRNDDGTAAGLSLELADYFQRHARQANGANAMLLTGTLSVISRCALVAAGGWSSATITEDAELGLRLRRLGYRGRLIDRIVGRGILPLDLGGLSSQRYRWAAGNVSTILTGLSGLPPGIATHVASQLTAWVNFALPLTAGLLGGSIALAYRAETTEHELMLNLAGAGLILVYLSACVPLVLSSAVRRSPEPSTVMEALAFRIALILPSAAGTMDALVGRCGDFRRTDKDVDDATGRIGPILPALALAGFALVVLVDLPALAGVGALLLILPFPLALFAQSRLADYRASVQTT